MVDSVLSFSRSGLRDWLLQRVSAVIIGLYALLMCCYFYAHPQLEFQVWHQFFEQFWVRIFSFITLLSIIIHAWVGLWTVLTDYVKPVRMAIFSQVALVVSLLILLAWGIEILWGL